jgi:hypothetical protein
VKRPDYLQAIHSRLLDWAQYTLTHPSGIGTLGCVVASYDGMVSSGMPAHSIVPTDIPPAKVGQIESILSDPETPQDHVNAIKTKYLKPKEVSRLVPRWRLKLAMEYLAGCVKNH